MANSLFCLFSSDVFGVATEWYLWKYGMVSVEKGS